MRKSLQLILLSLVLSACTSGKENFSTEPGQGFGWKSMQENNLKIQKGMEESLDAEKQKILPLTITPEPYLVQAGPMDRVERSSEQYLRIWFAPHQDTFGNLHEEAAVHTVIREGQWYVPNFTLDGNVA